MTNTCRIDGVKLYHCVLGISVRYSSDARCSADILVVEVLSGKWSGWGEVFLPRLEPLYNLLTFPCGPYRARR